MSNRRNAPTEDFTVLPCGHVFGAACILQWGQHCNESLERPGCPTCRFPIYHEGCGHHIWFRVFRGSDVGPHELPDRFPLVIADGGRVPPVCRSCREESGLDHLDKALDLLFGNSSLTRTRDPGSGPDAVSPDFLRSQVMDAYYKTRDIGNLASDEWL